MPHVTIATAAPVDLSTLPDDALLDRKQVAALSGFSIVALKKWATQSRGPKITRVEGCPRFKVRDVRAWLQGEAAENA